MAEPEDDITALLRAGGRDEAVAAVLPAVYRELHRLSSACLRRERPDHTLQATALVHEAYMRLAADEGSKWENRTHFLRAAALTMRRILINHARDQRALKRGGGHAVVRLEEVTAAMPEQEIDLVALDEALDKLATVDEQKARLVELRFFAGCSIEETASALGVSTATVGRDWRYARAWLRSAMREAAE